MHKQIGHEHQDDVKLVSRMNKLEKSEKSIEDKEKKLEKLEHHLEAEEHALRRRENNQGARLSKLEKNSWGEDKGEEHKGHQVPLAPHHGFHHPPGAHGLPGPIAEMLKKTLEGVMKPGKAADHKINAHPHGGILKPGAHPAQKANATKDAKKDDKKDAKKDDHKKDEAKKDDHKDKTAGAAKIVSDLKPKKIE